MSSSDVVTLLVAIIGPSIALLSGYILLRVKRQKPKRTVEDHLDTFLEAIISENKTLRKEIEKRDTYIDKVNIELNYLRAYAENRKAAKTKAE